MITVTIATGGHIARNPIAWLSAPAITSLQMRCR
jgi:hypothetical protein